MNDSHRYRTQRGPIRAARGTELSARSWLTEAPLRMLMNNLDPDVAERPDELALWRARLAEELAGREEGYVQDGRLVVGRPVAAVLGNG